MTLQGIILTCLLRLFSILPLRLNQGLGAAIGDLLCRIPNRGLRLSRRNIELCFPELTAAEREVLLRDSMRATLQTILELGYFWYQKSESVRGLIRHVHGRELFEQACDSGQGVLLLVPHLGCWELMNHYLPQRIESSFMYKQPRDRGVERVIVRGRERNGGKMIRADGKGVRHLMREIRQGHLVGVLPDQQPKQGQGEFAPFFGIEALTMVLVSRLAQKTGCKVLFGWMERLPQGLGYDFHFRTAAAEISDPDLRVSVTALNQGVEQCVRQCPAQYQWGYKRFGIRPDGEASLY